MKKINRVFTSIVKSTDIGLMAATTNKSVVIMLRKAMTRKVVKNNLNVAIAQVDLSSASKVSHVDQRKRNTEGQLYKEDQLPRSKENGGCCTCFYFE